MKIMKLEPIVAELVIDPEREYCKHHVMMNLRWEGLYKKMPAHTSKKRYMPMLKSEDCVIYKYKNDNGEFPAGIKFTLTLVPAPRRRSTTKAWEKFDTMVQNWMLEDSWHF